MIGIYAFSYKAPPKLLFDNHMFTRHLSALPAVTVSHRFVMLWDTTRRYCTCTLRSAVPRDGIARSRHGPVYHVMVSHLLIEG